jgi:plasmid stabilization system protein ParE
LSVELLLSAQSELDALEITNWYFVRSEKAAVGFVSEFLKSLDQIQADPLRFPVIQKHVHRLTMTRYPFVIVYRNHRGFVEVIAVIHHRRSGRVLRRRL